MREPFLCLLILSGLCRGAEGDRAAWIAEKQAIIADSKSKPEKEAMESLAPIVRGLGREKHLADDARELYESARDALMSYPEYADYFAGEIRRLTDAELGGTSTEHSSKRGWEAETLAKLPTPDSVRALGELLFDERDPFKGTPTDSPWVPTCFIAEDGLFEMGIKNPPVLKTQFPVLREDLHKWQDWYQEVKSGKRTFSFEGDENIYSLSGRVEAAAPVRSIPRTTPQPPQVIAEASPPTVEVPHRGWMVALALIIVAIAGIAVFRTSGKKRSL